MQNALTVDVEEWFHICGVEALAPPAWDRLASRVQLTTHLLLQEFARADVRATFLFLGWVADRHPDLVNDVLRAGHCIGSHSYSHQRVFTMTADAFDGDLNRSLRALNNAGATEIHCFRAPEWSIRQDSLWAFEVLARNGLRIDASMAPVRLVGDHRGPRHPHLRVTAAGPVLEMPPLVADRCGQVMPIGWGWGLRMSSPAHLLRTIDGENRAGRPAVLTIHPWELDPEPPRIQLPPRLRFAHYFRLGGFAGRLRELLAHGRFAPLETVAAPFLARSQ